MAGGPVVIIPARLGSTRLPGKVLLSETGRPLIAHVCEAASRCESIERVVVATDDGAVASAARSAGFEAVLTEGDHPNGTSRIAEASGLLGLGDDAVIVNVQGDEPEIEPGVIEAAAWALAGPGADVGTVVSPMAKEEDPGSLSVVKAVLGAAASSGGPRPALYFSRLAVPYGAVPGASLRHVGVYAYRAGFCRWYAAQRPTPLEVAEKLEQLRALELGRRVYAAERVSRGVGIDTAADYAAFVARWRAGSGLA